MAEVIISSPEGRIEGRYHQSSEATAPAVLVLHPHPLHGGTMNNKVVYNVYQTFAKNGFSTLRINFPGVGKSSGEFDNGLTELIFAAIALDWLQLQNPTASSFWVSGFSFGSWIALQLLMRRPEITNFVAVSPPTNKYDFSFLSPCPASGFVVQGSTDSVVPEDAVTKFMSKLTKQKNTEVDYSIINNGDHFFRTTMDELNAAIDEYLKRRLQESASGGVTKVDRRRRRQQAE